MKKAEIYTAVAHTHDGIIESPTVRKERDPLRSVCCKQGPHVDLKFYL